MASVAVLILNYNGEQHLKKYLPSILAHSPDCEVIVGDNNSTDGSLELLAERFPTVKTIKLSENYGYAGGYNRLISQLDHDYIALVNSDIEATPGWLEPLVAMLDEDSQLAAVQPKILSYTERNRFEYAGAAGGYIDKYGYPYCRGRVFDTLEEDLGQYNDIKDIFWASGACFIIKRAVFEEFGGFDDDFFAHMEEIDLFWRINNGGYKVKVNGNSYVYHLGGGTLSYASPRKTYLNFRNGWAMLLKNIPDAGRTGTILVRWWFDQASMLLFLLRLQPANAWAIVRAHYFILSNIRKIQNKRDRSLANNFLKANVSPNPHSLVWQYFFKKRKRYSDLIPN